MAEKSSKIDPHEMAIVSGARVLHVSHVPNPLPDGLRRPPRQLVLRHHKTTRPTRPVSSWETWEKGSGIQEHLRCDQVASWPAASLGISGVRNTRIRNSFCSIFRPNLNGFQLICYFNRLRGPNLNGF